MAAPLLDSPKQKLTFSDLPWLIIGGGFLLFLIWDSWLLLVVLSFSVYWYVRRSKEAQRTSYLRAYEFPAPVKERVRKNYPSLSEEQLSLVMLGLQQYFILCLAGGGRSLARVHSVHARIYRLLQQGAEPLPTSCAGQRGIDSGGVAPWSRCRNEDSVEARLQMGRDRPQETEAPAVLV